VKPKRLKSKKHRRGRNLIGLIKEKLVKNLSIR